MAGSHQLRCVIAVLIAILASQAAQAQEKHFGLWQSDGFWYPCEIVKNEPPITSVKFLDGDTADLAPDDVVRIDVQPGDEVWGRWQRGDTWYRGTVVAREGDSLQIRYEDGDEETTTFEFIRGKTTPPPAVGKAVYALWQEDGFWYPAVVKEVVGDEFLVEYEDESVQRRLPRKEVARFEVTFADEVQANWKKGGAYYPAEVIDRKDRTYRVRYTDGVVEEVDRKQLRIELVVTEQQVPEAGGSLSSGKRAN
jgi:hypothetical protein